MADEVRVHIQLTGPERRQLHNAFCRAFDHAGLAKLLSFELNERLDSIATQGGLDEIVLEVIEWAEIRGRVIELAEAARRQQPDNAAIVAACKTIEATATRRDPEPVDDPTPTPHQQAFVNPTPAPRVTPQPPPVSPPVSGSQPTASIGMLQIVHNLMVPHPGGLMPGLGMRIIVPGMLSGAMGQFAQLVVRFSFPNGAMVIAAPQEFTFRDPSGYCATGTAATPVTMPVVDLSQSMIMIPYYALNLTLTNGMMIYQLNAVASLYVNNVMIAESSPMPFSVRW